MQFAAIRKQNVIELAVVAPAAIMLVVGAVQIGAVVQAESALNAVVGDVGQFAIARRLAGDPQGDAQLASALRATAASGRYPLQHHLLTHVDAVTQTQPARAGLQKIDLTLTYAVPSWVPFLPQIALLEMRARKSVYVKAS